MKPYEIYSKLTDEQDRQVSDYASKHGVSWQEAFRMLNKNKLTRWFN